MLIAWKVNNCWTGFENQNVRSHHTHASNELTNTNGRHGLQFPRQPQRRLRRVLAADSNKENGRSFIPRTADWKKKTNISDKRLLWCQIMDVWTGLFHQTMNIAAKLRLLSTLVCLNRTFIPIKDQFVKVKLTCLQWNLLFTHVYDEHFNVFNRVY